MTGVTHSPANANTAAVPSHNAELGNAQPENQLSYPYQRLGAVTRVQHEIEELFPNFQQNVPLISSLLEKFSRKISTFIEICEDEFNKTTTLDDKKLFAEWYKSNKDGMQEFEIKMRERLNTATGNISAVREREELALGASAAGAWSDAGSRGSDRSTTSSARLRLLERKAKTLAQRTYQRKINDLEDQQRQIIRQVQELRLRQDEEEQQRLEEGLIAMENGIDTTPLPKKYIAKSTINEINEENETKLLQAPAMENILYKQNNIAESLLKAQQRSYLPHHVPDVFSGEDVTTYTPFKLSFERMIEAHCTDSPGRYYYLCQYTSKYAQQLVRSCHNKDPTVAYERARKILDERFGNSYVISEAYFEKLEKWPSISYDNGRSLEELSMFLASLVNLMEDMPELQHLNSHKEIKLVAEKLPYDLKKSWRTKVVNLMEAGVQVKFAHFERFVTQQSRILNQPVFGNIAGKDKKYQPRENKVKILATPTVAAEENNKENICLCCKKTNNHSLNECHFFQKEIVRRKNNFCTEKQFVLRLFWKWTSISKMYAASEVQKVWT